MRRRSGRSLLGSAVIVLAVLAGAAVLAWLAVRWLRPMVTVTRVVEGPVVQAFYSTGTVEPTREFPIKANHEGIITQLWVDKGDHVKAGQPLAMVEDKNLKYAYDKTNAELNEKLARADDKSSPVLAEFDAKIHADDDMLGIAQREMDRVLNLEKTGNATPFDRDRAEDHYKQVWADQQSLKSQRAAMKLQLDTEVAVARAALAAAKYDIDQQTVVSPTVGVVLDRPTSLGTHLAVNDHIMQIADVQPANLVMRAQIDEEDKNKVRMDQTVRMTLYSFPDEVFAGKVTRIYDKADSERRTFEIDVKLVKDDPRFSAGMTGELAFIMAEKESAPIIPAQAVQGEKVRIVRDGKLVTADVQLGLRSVERVEVVSGLSLSDRVVISPASNLPDGQPVRTEETDPTAASNLNHKDVVQSDFKGFN